MTKGQRIRQKREHLGISQTDFAKVIGVSKQTLYKYENDIVTNIPSDVIEKIAQGLRCSPEYIMGWKEDENSPDIFIEKFLSLSKENQNNVIQYIDFLSRREK